MQPEGRPPSSSGLRDQSRQGPRTGLCGHSFGHRVVSAETLSILQPWAGVGAARAAGGPAASPARRAWSPGTAAGWARLRCPLLLCRRPGPRPGQLPGRASPATGRMRVYSSASSFSLKNKTKNISIGCGFSSMRFSECGPGEARVLSGLGRPPGRSGTVPGLPRPLGRDGGLSGGPLLPEKAQPLPEAASRSRGQHRAKLTRRRAAPPGLSVSWWRTLSSSAWPASRRRGPC